jgi:hypothetical protein
MTPQEFEIIKEAMSNIQVILWSSIKELKLRIVFCLVKKAKDIPQQIRSRLSLQLITGNRSEL